MSEATKNSKPGPRKPVFEESPFARKLTWPDGLLLAFSLGFILVAILDVFRQFPQANGYTVLRLVHFQLSRYGLVAALVMLVIAVYIGILRKRDVTPWFRRGAYVILGTMVVQALIGAYMMFVIGADPGRPEHLIYGIGTVLALPFFIFVETTAQKRPAMGVIIRSISTGPVP